MTEERRQMDVFAGMAIVCVLARTLLAKRSLFVEFIYFGIMKIGEILSAVESFAAPELQEDYDNAGLITGNRDWTCTGILCTLDVTPAVVKEAD